MSGIKNMIKPFIASMETAGKVPVKKDKLAATACPPWGYGILSEVNQPGISLIGRKDLPSGITLFATINEILDTCTLASQIPVGHPIAST